MVKVDSKKLEQMVLNEMSELAINPAFLESTICIGEVDGMQIQLKVTKEEDDFHDDLKPEFICVTESP